MVGLVMACMLCVWLWTVLSYIRDGNVVSKDMAEAHTLVKLAGDGHHMHLNRPAAGGGR